MEPQKKAQGLAQRLRRLLRLRVVTRRDVATICILLASIGVNFIYLRFGSEVVDGFITVSRPMTAQWYVYLVGSDLSATLVAWFAYRVCQKNLKPLALFYLIWCLYHEFLFFWNYNERSYYYLPYLVLILITWRLYKR